MNINFNNNFLGNKKLAITTLALGVLIGCVAASSTIASAASDIQQSIAEIINPTPRHPISDSITGVSAEEASNIKGRAISKIGHIPRFREGGYQIEILKMNSIEGGVEVFARAWDMNGNQIGFGVDGTVDIERFRFFNPPILVPDGTKSERISPVLGIKTEKDNFKEDPEKAIQLSLAHTISLVGKNGNKIVAGKFGNTTDTYSSSPGTATPADGYTGFRAAGYPASGVSWSTARSSNGSFYGSASSDEILTGWETIGGTAVTKIWRGVLQFDTSPITDSDIISDATLSIYGQAKADPNGDSPSVNIYQGGTGSSADVVSSDYQLNQATDPFSSEINYGGFNLSGYNNFVLNLKGLAAINSQGISKFSFKTTNDANNTAPSYAGTVQTYIEGYEVDHSGTTNDPKLIVVHSWFPVEPTGLQISAPTFSAIFQDASSTVLATHYELQIGHYSSVRDWGTPFWDSGKQTLSSSTPRGFRSPIITSTSTLVSGQTYFWRIRFWDQSGNEGAWSTSTPLFMVSND